MNPISKRIVERLRTQFPRGTRVVLDHMNDIHAPESGTKGTVICVDDRATIHVNWDGGGSLGVAFGEDRCHKIHEDEIVNEIEKEA